MRWLAGLQKRLRDSLIKSGNRVRPVSNEACAFAAYETGDDLRLDYCADAC